VHDYWSILQLVCKYDMMWRKAESTSSKDMVLQKHLEHNRINIFIELFGTVISSEKVCSFLFLPWDTLQ
jgi:hypothetical protein